MRNRNTIYTLLLTLVIVGGFLVMWAASPAKQQNSDPCKESMDPCCKKGGTTNNATWETLPQRFFSSLAY